MELLLVELLDGGGGGGGLGAEATDSESDSPWVSLLASGAELVVGDGVAWVEDGAWTCWDFSGAFLKDLRILRKASSERQTNVERT